jgi:hypothetical protein
MGNTEPITIGMIQVIENFAKTNPDDYEYILALSSGCYGWLELSSGKTVYVSPPRSSAEEVGKACKNLFNNIQREDSKISKLFKEVGIDLVNEESQQIKNLPDILNDLSQKWNENKNR